MPPLTSPSALAARYRELTDALAYYRTAPVRKGRKKKVADLEKQAAFALEQIAKECARLWNGATADGRRLAAADVDKAMRGKRPRKRGKLETAA